MLYNTTATIYTMINSIRHNITFITAARQPQHGNSTGTSKPRAVIVWMLVVCLGRWPGEARSVNSYENTHEHICSIINECFPLVHHFSTGTPFYFHRYTIFFPLVHPLFPLVHPFFHWYTPRPAQRSTYSLLIWRLQAGRATPASRPPGRPAYLNAVHLGGPPRRIYQA